MSYKILIVDDEPANLRILERLFRVDYTVLAADSGSKALEMLAQHDVALIVSDQRMPVMTGIDFLKKAAEMRPSTVRIILTGYTDVNALVEAINSGVVYKYATKPWVNEDLRQTVNRALEHYETLKAQHQLKLQNQRLETRLKTTLENCVKIIAQMLDLKEPDLYNHVRRTGESALAVGQSLNLQPEELEQLSLAALLHEFAPIDVPNQSVLNTAEVAEWEPQVSINSFARELEMLANVPDLEEVASVLSCLHEQFDGNGYPGRLAGERIPLHARIIAVADAFDKLTLPRDFKLNLTQEDAIMRLQSFAGERFDPKIVKIFCNLKSSEQVQDVETSDELSLIE
ncbi:MAG TPA: HD domain-containing phosphohydrolase [Pyrinomonadaceae bacterium]|nr:HD domain-containing phosphohydrolase [Pyrinomonadaceae bacterium]